MNDALPDPAAADVPRVMLLSAAGLIVLALLAVLAVRLSGLPISTPDAPAAVVRELRFADLPDGSIAVTDARTQATVARIEGASGFVRGTLRGLARERRRAGVGAEVPFQLVGRADGRLTLIDPATDRRVDIESFGPTNSADFARLLNGATP